MVLTYYQNIAGRVALRLVWFVETITRNPGCLCLLKYWYLLQTFKCSAKLNGAQISHLIWSRRNAKKLLFLIFALTRQAVLGIVASKGIYTVHRHSVRERRVGPQEGDPFSRTLSHTSRANLYTLGQVLLFSSFFFFFLFSQFFHLSPHSTISVSLLRPPVSLAHRLV